MQQQGTDPVQDFGNYLRAERELRQIPLLEVAWVTKIPEQTLDALETGDWSDLPAEVFVTGFVRSYARHVGLPEGDACARYRRTLELIEEKRAMEPGIPVGEAATEVSNRGRFGLALFIIIVLILATITLSILLRGNGHADVRADVVDAQTPLSDHRSIDS